MASKFGCSCDSVCAHIITSNCAISTTFKHILLVFIWSNHGVRCDIVAINLKFVCVKCVCWPVTSAIFLVGILCPFDSNALATLFPIHFSFSLTLNRFEYGLFIWIRSLYTYIVFCLFLSFGALFNDDCFFFFSYTFYTYIYFVIVIRSILSSSFVENLMWMFFFSFIYCSLVCVCASFFFLKDTLKILYCHSSQCLLMVNNRLRAFQLIHERNSMFYDSNQLII